MERTKRRLVEVFSVRFSEDFWAEGCGDREDGEDIFGFTLLQPSGGDHHGRLFKRNYQDLPIINKAGFVKLTGPTHGVEVKDELVIHAYLWSLFCPLVNMNYANTLWISGVEETDQFIFKVVETEFSPMEVSFAVYSDAVEARFDVSLVGWEAIDGVQAFGTVDAGNSRIPGTRASSSLFGRSIVDDAINVKPGKDVTSLPLSRSVTVVPHESTLFVDVIIWRMENSRRHHEPIFKKLSFDARSTGTETKVACGDRGNVEVTVTWSS